MTRITFIMPTFNRADYIAESLDSVLSQIGADDDMIIVDDGSTDSTEAAVAPYLGRVRYLKQENAGKSVALNRALAETAARYIWICDDDDLLNPGVVEPMVEKMERSAIDVLFGRYTRFTETTGQRQDLGTGYWPDLSQGSPSRHILEDAFVMHNATLVRRDAYAELGGFDEAMLRSQDYEMFVRLAISHSIAFVDRQIFLQRKHPGHRGPAKIAHSAGASDSVWEQYDRRIFENLRDVVPPEYFTSMFDSSVAALAQRAGVLQRACILARHGLWDDALIDCLVAAEIAPEMRLHPLEIAICRRFTAGKHGFAGLLAPANASRFARLCRAGGQGRSVAAEISRGLFWRVRQADDGMRRLALQHLIKLRSILALALRGLPDRHLPAADLCEITPDPAIGAQALARWAVHRDGIIAPTG